MAKQPPGSRSTNKSITKKIDAEILAPSGDASYKTLEDLLATINDPQDRERLQTHLPKLLEEQKLASLRAFAYGLSHEINNPLANIATRAQTLIAGETDPERKRRLAVIVAQAFRAHEMIADLMLFAKPPKIALQPIDLVAISREVVAGFADEAASQATLIEFDELPESLSIQADNVQIRVALQAIIRNALEAVAHGGTVRLAIEASDSTATIFVRDNGQGLTAEAQQHLFDPFFSGREAGRGLGLGLCKSYRIAQLHGGRISARNLAPSGCEIALSLPIGSIAAAT